MEARAARDLFKSQNVTFPLAVFQHGLSSIVAQTGSSSPGEAQARACELFEGFPRTWQ